MFKRVAYSMGRALRETGAAIDRVGLRALEKPVFKEPFARHRPVMNLYEKRVPMTPRPLLCRSSFSDDIAAR